MSVYELGNGLRLVDLTKVLDLSLIHILINSSGSLLKYKGLFYISGRVTCAPAIP